MRPGKLLKQYEELKAKQDNYLHNGQIMQAMNMNPKISEVKRMLDDYMKREEDRKYQEKVTLRELLPQDKMERFKIHKLLVKVSLASDYLYDCMAELEHTLNKMGILVNSLSEESKDVCKRANGLASKLLVDKAPKLGEVLLDDEPMIDKLHEVVDRYIDSTLTTIKK